MTIETDYVNFELNHNDLNEVSIKRLIPERPYKNFEKYCTEILTENGWEHIESDYPETGDEWKKDFTTSCYTTSVYITIGYRKEHLEMAWQYGIAWIEGEYEYQNRPLGMNDIKDMIEGIHIGIDHLLAKGIPFHPNSTAFKEYDLSWYERKRNEDLLRELRITDENIRAIIEYSFEGDEGKFVNYIMNEDKEKSDWWIRRYIENHEMDKKYKKKEQNDE